MTVYGFTVAPTNDTLLDQVAPLIELLTLKVERLRSYLIRLSRASPAQAKADDRKHQMAAEKIREELEKSAP